MDGPNVSLKLQKLLMNADVLTNINKLFSDIGTRPLHVVHNSLRKGVAALNFDIDQYAFQGLTNCAHGDDCAHNVHAKKFLHAQNLIYVHVKQSNHF